MGSGFAAWLHSFRRERLATQEWAEAVITLCTEQGFSHYVALRNIYRGWALAEQGRGEKEIQQIHQGIAAWRATGAELSQTYWLALLADAYGKVGQPQKGLSVLAEALATVSKNGERYCEAELYRLKGTLTLQSKASLVQVQNKSKTSQDKSEVTNT